MVPHLLDNSEPPEEVLVPQEEITVPPEEDMVVIKVEAEEIPLLCSLETLVSTPHKKDYHIISPNVEALPVSELP